MKSARIISSLIASFISLCVTAQVYFDQKATGLNNGTSWADAYKSLDSALINTAEGEIWVAKGIYRPTIPIDSDNDPRKVSFFFKPMVSCFGGFAGSEVSKTQRDILNNPTVLSGNIGQQDVIEDNAYHIIYNDYEELDTNSVFDGFVITGSYFDYDWENDNGGGVYLNHAGTPIVRNCIIMENHSLNGGGIYVWGCDPIIQNNLIVNNQAFDGAGILLDWYTNAILKGNKILFNESKDYQVVGSSSLTGGGIQIGAYSIPFLSGNLIADNYAGHKGGGLYIDSNLDINVFNNYFIENTAEDGGGIFIDGTNTNFINNLIIKNSASEYGGGIYMDYTGNTRLINSTISLNSSFSGGGLFLADANIDVVNTILYHNKAQSSSQAFIYIGRADWRPEFSYCQVEGGLDDIGIYTEYDDSIYFENNYLTSPLFLDTINNDYQVSNQSDAIDGGIQDTTGLGLLDYDYLLNPRIFNNRVDIGAIEYNGFYSSLANIYNKDSIHSVISRIKIFIISGTLNSLPEMDDRRFLVYPNPFVDYITVDAGALRSIYIYTEDGKLMLSKPISNGQRINLSTLKKGIYILRCGNGLSRKIIKQ